MTLKSLFCKLVHVASLIQCLSCLQLQYQSWLSSSVTSLNIYLCTIQFGYDFFLINKSVGSSSINANKGANQKGIPVSQVTTMLLRYQSVINLTINLTVSTSLLSKQVNINVNTLIASQMQYLLRSLKQKNSHSDVDQIILRLHVDV